jgi:hypothetical protein
VPHTFYAEVGGARALVGFAPLQFEEFLREVGEPAPERVVPPPLEGHPNKARLAPIALRGGFEILGPPGPRPDTEPTRTGNRARSRCERAHSPTHPRPGRARQPRARPRQEKP